MKYAPYKLLFVDCPRCQGNFAWLFRKHVECITCRLAREFSKEPKKKKGKMNDIDKWLVDEITVAIDLLRDCVIGSDGHHRLIGKIEAFKIVQRRLHEKKNSGG